MLVKGAERQAIAAGRLIVLVFFVLLLIAVGTVWLVFSNARDARDDLLRSYQQLITTQQLLSALQDAEAGQRGFLLSADPEYLQPYDRAIERIQPVLDALTRGILQQQSDQIARLTRLRLLIDDKLAELAQTIRQAQTGNHAEVLTQIQSDKGKILMDDIRMILDEFDQANRRLIGERTQSLERASALWLLGTLLVVCLLPGWTRKAIFWKHPHRWRLLRRNRRAG